MVSSIREPLYKKYKNNQATIVKGNFSSLNNKENALLKINRFLSTILILSIIISVVSYSIVAAKESSIATVHTKTTEISYENIDLQSQVDKAKSFYNVNQKAAALSSLKKADKILEVKALAKNTELKMNFKETTNLKPMAGY